MSKLLLADPICLWFIQKSIHTFFCTYCAAKKQSVCARKMCANILNICMHLINGESNANRHIWVLAIETLYSERCKIWFIICCAFALVFDIKSCDLLFFLLHDGNGDASLFAFIILVWSSSFFLFSFSVSIYRSENTHFFNKQLKLKQLLRNGIFDI